VAGHRTSWFRPLEKIRTGDNIEWQWFDARREKLPEREYRAERIVLTTPDDVGLLRPTEEDALTLIACYPFGHGATSPQRFVVRAVPVGSKNGA
jgi:LPXTG-site transpeptidase (sortase) family protein